MPHASRAARITAPARVLVRLAAALAFALALALVLTVTAGCGPTDCTAHEDCAQGEVCRFGSPGECLKRCEDDSDCGLAQECNRCATGSCPECDDCVAACVSRLR